MPAATRTPSRKWTRTVIVTVSVVVLFAATIGWCRSGRSKPAALDSAFTEYLEKRAAYDDSAKKLADSFKGQSERLDALEKENVFLREKLEVIMKAQLESEERSKNARAVSQEVQDYLKKNPKE